MNNQKKYLRKIHITNRTESPGMNGKYISIESARLERVKCTNKVYYNIHEISPAEENEEEKRKMVILRRKKYQHWEYLRRVMIFEHARLVFNIITHDLKHS